MGGRNTSELPCTVLAIVKGATTRWSFLLLHNTAGGVLWAGETRVNCLAPF